MADKLLKTKIRNSILKDIINGVYAPDHIFNEKALIEKYGISKSPIRDALIELCNEEVLKSIPRYGYEIVKITERQVREIIELRVLLECDGLRKLCKHIDNNCIQTLKDCVEKNLLITSTPNVDVWKHWNLHTEFHILLYSFSNNEYAKSVLEKSLNFLTRAYTQLYWNEIKKNLPCTNGVCHLNIVQLLEQKKYEEAIDCLKNDIQSFRFIDRYKSLV